MTDAGSFFIISQLLLSGKITTFAHGYLFCLATQSNHKGLTPAIGASPNFSSALKKVYRTVIKNIRLNFLTSQKIFLTSPNNLLNSPKSYFCSCSTLISSLA